MECEWQSCGIIYGDYEQFQKHIKDHIKDLHVINNEDGAGKKEFYDIIGKETSVLHQFLSL